MASRDRLAEGKEKLALEDALVTWLKDHDTLHILNEERKQKELEKAMKDTTVSQDVFKNLVKQNQKSCYSSTPLYMDISYRIRSRDFLPNPPFEYQLLTKQSYYFLVQI